SRAEPKHDFANSFRRLARDDFEFAAVLQQFRQATMHQLARIAAERLLDILLQFAARTTFLAAEQIKQLLRRELPAHFAGIDVTWHDPIASVADAHKLTGKHDAASAARW